MNTHTQETSSRRSRDVLETFKRRSRDVQETFKRRVCFFYTCTINLFQCPILLQGVGLTNQLALTHSPAQRAVRFLGSSHISGYPQHPTLCWSAETFRCIVKGGEFQLYTTALAYIYTLEQQSVHTCMDTQRLE